MSAVVGARHWFPGSYPPHLLSRSARILGQVPDTSELSFPNLRNFDAASFANGYASPSESVYLRERIEVVVTPDPADGYDKVDTNWVTNAAGEIQYIGTRGTGIVEVDDDELMEEENEQALLATRLEVESDRGSGSDEFRITSPVDPNHIPPAPRLRTGVVFTPTMNAHPYSVQALSAPDEDSSDSEDYGTEVIQSRFRAFQLIGFRDHAVPEDGRSTNAAHIRIEQPPQNISSISAQNPLPPPIQNQPRSPLSPLNTTRSPAPQAYKPEMDEFSDLALVNSNLALLEEAMVDVEAMFSPFTQSSQPGLLVDHVETCRRVKYTLTCVKHALGRRKQLTPGQWASRSARWQEKYSQRLLSLQRTLQRLRAIKRMLESRTRLPRRDQLRKLLEKLAQHERKLADLATKFNAAFDRLIAKHLHSMLSAAHISAAQLKSDHVGERDTFRRKWSQGKAIRAHLRQQFFKFTKC